MSGCILSIWEVVALCVLRVDRQGLFEFHSSTRFDDVDGWLPEVRRDLLNVEKIAGGLRGGRHGFLGVRGMVVWDDVVGRQVAQIVLVK